MTHDDPVGSATRRALYRFAFRDAVNLRPWSEIRALGRRIQRRRIAAGVAGVAIVFTGAGAANALVVRGSPGGEIRSDGTVPSTTSTTSVTSAETPTSETVTSTSEATPLPPAAPEIPVSTEATTTTTEPVLPPYDANAHYTGHTTAERSQVTAGEEIVLHATLENTGTQAFETLGYGSIGVACQPWPADSAPMFFDLGEFLDYAVLQPGESRTFTVTLIAPDFVGEVACGLGLAYHGDAFAAGPNYADPGANAYVQIVAPSDGSTTAPEPTTSTTASDASAGA